MVFRPTLWAAVLLVSIVSMSASVADVVLSTSNNPKVVAGDEVRGMLSNERSALSTVSAKRMRDLVIEPKRRSAANGRRNGASLYSVEFLKNLPARKGDETWRCLTEALYFEARGEDARGVFAVGEVILNRVEHAEFPNDVCGVIYQGTGKRYQCQFTYSCDGQKEVVQEPQAWKHVGKVASLLLDGTAPRDLTDGATHYHTKSVKPRWSRVYPRTVTIGYHHFYRRAPRYASN